MDLSNITRLISSLRAQTARDSITPDGLGSILQRIVDAISSMSSIDIEDENAILQRLSTAEADAQTALQTAQNAQAGAAANVIDTFTADQDVDEVTLSLKQHGYTAKQVVLPAASSTGAGVMTATDKSHLGTAYGKRVNLMNTLSSETVVTLQITFGDGTTKSVTFVGATAGNGGKAGLMTKEQADQLAALVAAGTAESVRDDAGFIKQQYAAPVVLRNVTDEEVDDLSVGDIFFDSGKLWQCGSSENIDMGTPSKKVIYYCLADQTLYRWTGSRFVQAVHISSGDINVPTKLSDLINDMGFLTAHQPLKTINGQSIAGTGNITIDGAAELKDASNHIKQSMAAPMVLRNVTDEEVSSLVEGDVFFDSGILWYHGASGNVSLGSPSKNLIYYCRGDQKFYRWTGSSFTSVGGGGTAPVISISTVTGNWVIDGQDTGVHAQGETGNITVTDGVVTFGLVNNLSSLDTDKGLTAKMGHDLLALIARIYESLGESAFWEGKPYIDWSSIGLLTHAVTRNLSHCHSNKTYSQIADGSSLNETITFDEGYVKDTLMVTMNNEAVPSQYISGNTINIPSVTGPVVITATAHSAKSVSLNLTGCSSSNDETGVNEGASYTTKIDANQDHQCVTPNISVLMNGVALPVVLEDGYPLNAEPVTDSSASGYNYVDIATQNCVIYKADTAANAEHRYRPYFEVSIKNVTGNIVITASVMNILADRSIAGTKGQTFVDADGNVANRTGWCHTEIYIPMFSTSCRWYWCGANLVDDDLNTASLRVANYVDKNNEGYFNANSKTQNYRDVTGITKTRLARLSFKFNNGTLTGCGLYVNDAFIFKPDDMLPANS